MNLMLIILIVFVSGVFVGALLTSRNHRRTYNWQPQTKGGYQATGPDSPPGQRKPPKGGTAAVRPRKVLDFDGTRCPLLKGGLQRPVKMPPGDPPTTILSNRIPAERPTPKRDDD